MPAHRHELSCLDGCPHATTQRGTPKWGSLPVPRGIARSITLQAEGDARTAAEGTPVVLPLPRGTSEKALRKHAYQLWTRYHRNEILPTYDLVRAHLDSAAKLYEKTFLAAYKSEIARSPLPPERRHL